MKGLWALTLALGVLAPMAQAEMVAAEAGVLRWLDKLTGETGDLELAVGQSATNGRLKIDLADCRYPAANPAGDAEIQVTIHDTTRQGPVFDGWMIASSPALSAMDHPRYDVWPLACVLPGDPAATEPAEGE